MIHWSSKIRLSSGKYKRAIFLSNKDKIHSFIPDFSINDFIDIKVSKGKRYQSNRIVFSNKKFIDCYYSDLFIVKDINNRYIFRKIYDVKDSDRFVYISKNMKMSLVNMVSFFSDTKKVRTVDVYSNSNGLIIINGFLKMI